MSALETAITKVIIEKIEVEAVLAELERAFPLLDSRYYYARKLQMETRQKELKAILKKAEVGYVEDAPTEQWLVTRFIG